MFLKKSISYFINIMYKHIFLNFGVISFINKEMVSLFQLHTYKFGLVYIAFAAKTILTGPPPSKNQMCKPHHEKTYFLHLQKTDADQLALKHRLSVPFEGSSFLD